MENNKLTDEDVETINSIVEESTKDNVSTKIMNDIKEGNINTDSGIKETTAIIDTDSNGTPMVLSTTDEKKDTQSIENFLEELGGSDIGDVEDTLDYTISDIRDNAKNNVILEDQEFNISDESVLKLIDIMNRVRAKEEVNIYSEFPQEIKDMINGYLTKNGMGGYNVTSNTVRNSISRELVDEFISNIGIDHCIEEFNEKIENIWSNVDTKMSGLYKDYSENRNSYIESLLSKVPEEDIEKREKLTRVLDSIHDAYSLQRMKDEYSTNSHKIKRITVQKYTKVFDQFLKKYQNTKYHIYDLKLVLDILNRHNITEDKYDNLYFLLIFCEFCRNYNPEIVEEHAFMYYTIYNIVLLDVYKEEDYNEYSVEILKNINEIISYIKKPNMENLYECSKIKPAKH